MRKMYCHMAVTGPGDRAYDGRLVAAALDSAS